jgi:arsenate reductase
MEVQIFGTRSCNETKKALRFFKERRIRTHFVDLKERAASAGELKRFAERFGAAALLDRDGKRFRDRGLHVAHVPDARILPLVEDDPLLLKTPLLRAGKNLAVGWSEGQWKEWIQQAGS